MRDEYDEYPVCAECGEVLDIYMYEIEGEFYCDWCMKKKFQRDVDEWLEEQREIAYDTVMESKRAQAKDEA